MSSFFQKILGSRNERILKRYQKSVNAVNRFSDEFKALDDSQLRAKTDEFRQRLATGSTLNDLLPEAFAVVREVAERQLGLRHYDVQLIGGIALHEGEIAEMRTGEGKTLVATLDAYLNALSGRGVHIVTVNDYLAQRDAEWMRPVYEALGMTLGVIVSQATENQDTATKRAAYACDITYGTNNEFGFDYLRDNLAQRAEDRVQRPLHHAIVDEVDSILIDEARTPLIISGAAEDNTKIYLKINQLIPKLVEQKIEDGPGDYSVDEKIKQIYLTEDGHRSVEKLLVQYGLISENESVYDARNISLMHFVNEALRGHSLFHRDDEYIVSNGEVVIVDEFTGRPMPGRRWSEGLHQAIEAKEGVRIQRENQTLASITFQNYFRLYEKLSGMTGTADTEAAEFHEIYGLEVVIIPTHKPMVRDDRPDLMYLTREDKFNAIVEEIDDCKKRNQPVLVGTTSVETSELLAQKLNKLNVKHEVLNAKQHEREAQIVKDAGKPGSVTIATNMAGRGTDIVLGGRLDANKDGDISDEERQQWQVLHDQVIDSGGLHIVGTERHESRRIDNQLRGRSGRQGDPGSSRFFLSLEDDLMRIFGNPERTKAWLQRVGMKPGEAIESKMLSRQIERAQRRVESHNFDSRKQLLEYDDVANEQRKVIYSQRIDLLEAEDIADMVVGIRHDVIESVVFEYMSPDMAEEQWDLDNLSQKILSEFGLEIDSKRIIDQDADMDAEKMAALINQRLDDRYRDKTERFGAENMRQLEQMLMLQQLDMHWREHLGALNYLMQGIRLRGYAQKNPKQEYKRESFEMFGEMLERMKYAATSMLCRVELRDEGAADHFRERDKVSNLHFRHDAAQAPQAASPDAPVPIGGRSRTAARSAPVKPYVREDRKVGRNEPCPCGSGKKYKRCHGRIDQSQSQQEDSNAA
ncbi:MAG: preprotein translocase subunit SecA [Gammaproteobacteria bacterium]|nr:preprotein translocase subunit SecA [Gammaproteobacteria bacterium]